MILAADVGGTKANLGLFEGDGLEEAKPPEPVCESTLVSADHDSLAAVVRTFLDEHDVDPERVEVACFGVAGPVIRNRAEPSNLDWGVIDGGALCGELGLGRVLLINDLVATGWGIDTLPADCFQVLQAGDEEADGNRVLIAAGTGLGTSVLPFADGRHVPYESEGGHVDFAPRNPQEAELLHYLLEDHDRVSVERVVSGSGLVAIYRHLRAQGSPGSREVEAAVDAASDPAPEITKAALEKGCPRAVEALDRFASAYGAAAGNLALVGLATAGVYVGGGIAPKILGELEDGTFLEGFRSKGRFRELMESLPVRVILEPKTALFGAARRAAMEREEASSEDGC